MTNEVKDNAAPDQPLETRKGTVSRRFFLQTGAAAFSGATLGSAAAQSRADDKDRLSAGQNGGQPFSRMSPATSSFIDLLGFPNAVEAYGRFDQTIPVDGVSLSRRGEQWAGRDVVVETSLRPDALALTLEAPSTPIAVVHVRWQFMYLLVQ